MMEILKQPWSWYTAGAIIGLIVPALLILGNYHFGISANLRHACAACFPADIKFFKYDWKAESWNLVFALGMVIGGCIAGCLFKNPNPIALSESAIESMNSLGVKNYSGLIPTDVFNFPAL